MLGSAQLSLVPSLFLSKMLSCASTAEIVNHGLQCATYYAECGQQPPESRIVASQRQALSAEKSNGEVEAVAQVISQKREQVKRACNNCRKACKKCDSGRPCFRCIKFRIQDTCADSGRRRRHNRSMLRWDVAGNDSIVVVVTPCFS